MLHYTYTATGQKISQQLEDEDKLGTRRDYAGPFVYVNHELGWVNTPHGRIYNIDLGSQGSQKEYILEFHLRDHLGNTRLVLEKHQDEYIPTQQAFYYPFGMAIAGLSRQLPENGQGRLFENRYLYNSKEFQDDFGLNWYDYGARFYDPQIARWHNLDPLAELGRRWSPYTHAFNNPIRFVDPDGRWPFDPQQTFDPLPRKDMDFFPDKDENESLFPFRRENMCGCEGEKSGKNLMDYETNYIGFRGKGNTNDKENGESTNGGDWPSTSDLEKDFADSFNENVVENYVDNPDYKPQNANQLANDLLYSGDLFTQKYYFGLRPIEMRISTFENNKFVNTQMYYTDPYINNDLPTVLSPGYYAPLVIYGEGNTAYQFVIRYQIRLPF